MQNDPSGAAGAAMLCSRPHHPDVGREFAHLANTVALLNWFAGSAVSSTKDAAGRAVYEFSVSDGDQLMSILRIADEWAGAIVREHDL